MCCSVCVYVCDRCECVCVCVCVYICMFIIGMPDHKLVLGWLHQGLILIIKLLRFHVCAICMYLTQDDLVSSVTVTVSSCTF